MQRVVDETVSHLGLEVLRHSTLADAFGDGTSANTLELLRLDVLVQDRARRVCKPALDSALALVLEVSRRTSKGTSRASSCDEAVELASVGLSPDLRACRLDVSLTIGDVVELVCPYGIVQSLGMPASLVVVVLGIVERYCWDREDLGAKHPQEVNLLLGLGVGHVDDTLVVLGAADVGQTDTGVTCCSFDDSTTGANETCIAVTDVSASVPSGEEAATTLTFLFCVHDNPKGSSVLDTATRLHEFSFAIDLSADLFAEAVDPDQWRVADCADEAIDGTWLGTREVRRKGGCTGSHGTSCKRSYWAARAERTAYGGDCRCRGDSRHRRVVGVGRLTMSIVTFGEERKGLFD